MSTKEQEERVELLQGTLDLLILRALQLGPTHGHAIAKAIELRSDDVLCKSNRALFIRHCTGSSSVAGLPWRPGPQRTTDGPSSTA